MLKSKFSKFAVAIAIAGLMIPAGLAYAADEPTEFPSTSQAPVWIVDGDLNIQYPAGSLMQWDNYQTVHFSPIPVPATPTDYETVRMPFVAGSEQYINFMSLPGNEFNRTTGSPGATSGTWLTPRDRYYPS